MYKKNFECYTPLCQTFSRTSIKSGGLEGKSRLRKGTGERLPEADLYKQSIARVIAETSQREDPVLTRIIFQYLGWATFWLVVGTLAGGLVALKFRFPDFLDAPFLSFGRLRAVHTNTVFWGWTSLAMMGLALYAVPRASKTELYSIRLAKTALWIWNVMVLAGILALASGINNGNQEYREYVWPLFLLFAATLILHLINFYNTVVRRKMKEIYISNWYILSAFLWTLVLGTIAYLPWYQHGLGQTVIQGYYMHNGVGMWFTPLAVGLTYYFLPLFLNRPIYSYALGVLGFWTQLVFYTLIGTHHYIFSPIPWLLQTIAILFSAGMMVPVWAGTGNFLLTMKGMGGLIRRSYSLPFLLVGIVSYGIASAQGTAEAFRTANLYWHLTGYTVGHAHFTMYGFVAFLIWGGIYGLLPRLTGKEPPVKAVGVHFWMSTVGLAIYVVALSIGGTIQGLQWIAQNPFIQSVTAMAPYWLWRAVGGMLMILGHLVFAYNLFHMRPAAKAARALEAGGQA